MLQERRQNINQKLYPQQTPHTSPWRASYGMPYVNICDRVITAPHCIWITLFKSLLLFRSCLHQSDQLVSWSKEQLRKRSAVYKLTLPHFITFKFHNFRVKRCQHGGGVGVGGGGCVWGVCVGGVWGVGWGVGWGWGGGGGCVWGGGGYFLSILTPCIKSIKLDKLINAGHDYLEMSSKNSRNIME